MKRNKMKIIRIAAFLIPAVTVLIGMIMGGFAPFGEKDVLTAGGMSNYIPYFTELYDKVHNGESLVYSLKSGLGYDFTTVWTYYLSDPLNLIVLLFPKSAMLAVMNFLYLLKIGLAGLFFSIFLTYRQQKTEASKNAMAFARADEISAYEKKLSDKKKKAEQKSGNHKKNFKIGGHEAPNTHFGMFISQLDVTNLAFSVAYALSGYMLGQGLNITWLSSVALFPLIIMGLDMLIQEGRWKLYTVTYLLSFYMNLHMTIVISVFLFLYFILQDYRNFRHFAKSFGFKLFSDMLAAGSAMVIILNCVNSSFFRKDFSLQFPYSGTQTSVFDVFKMQMSGMSPSSVWTYANGIDIYCGAAVLFLLFLYFFNKNINIKAKLKNSALLLILFAGLFIVTPNYLLNGFFYSDKNTCVFGFIFIFMLLSIGYEAFENMSFAKSAQVTLSALLFSAMVITSIIFAKQYESMSPFLTTLEMMFLFYILTLLWKNDSMTKLVFTVSFSLFMIAEGCFIFTGQFKAVGNAAPIYADTMDYKLDAAENYIHQKEPNARILVYDTETSNSTPLTNTLLGYQYVITDAETVDTLLEYQETYQGISIYKNPYVIENGFFIGEEILDWDYNQNYPYTSFNILTTNILKSEEVFHILDGDFFVSDGYIIDSNGNMDDSVASYRFNFVTPVTADIYSNFTHLIHIGSSEAGETVHFSHTLSAREIQHETFAAQFVAFDREAFLSLYHSLSQNTGNRNTITPEGSDAGYVLMPLSEYDNWRINGAYNGIPVTIGSETCLLVPVPEGGQTIELIYRPHYLYTGLCFSVLFLVILVLLLCLSGKEVLTRSYNCIRKASWLNNLTEFINSNYVYFITFFIAAFLFIFMLMYESCVPFGNNSAIVSDGYIQTYPIFTQFYNNLRHGDLSLLNFSLGFGMDNFMLNLATLLCPPNWLYLLFPESMSLVGFTFVYMVKFCLIGITFIFYLTHRPNGKNMDKKDIRLIPIAMAYNFCAFSVSYLCFGFFAEIAIMLPIVILTMEKLVYEKKILPYMLVMTYMMLVGTYYTFLLCEFLVLYYFLLEHQNVKNFFLNGIRFAASSVLSAGIAAVSLIPFYIFTQQSSYQSGDTFPAFHLSNTFLQSFRNLQIGGGAVIITKDFTRANTYCGILLLLFIPLYLLNKNVKTSQKIRRMLLVLLLFFSYGNEFMNFVLHGFHYQSMVPNRFSIFLIFIVIVMFYDCIIAFENAYTKEAVITFTAFAAAVIGITVYNNHDSMLSFSAIITIVFIVLYVIALIGGFLSHKKKHKCHTNTILLSLLIVELMINSVVCMIDSFGYPATLTTANNNRIEKLADKYDINNELARTEFPGMDLYNNSALTNLNSASAFSSMMTQAQIDLILKWNVFPNVNSIAYDIGNPLANMMLNVQYNFTSQYYIASVSIMDQIDHAGNINMYKNRHALSLGIFFDDSCRDFDLLSAKAGSCFDYQNSFSQTVINKDIYDKIELERNADNVSEHVSYCLIDMDAFADETSDTIPAKVLIASDISGDIYMDYYTYMFYLGTATEGEQNEFIIDLPKIDDNKDSYTLSIACLNDENFNELYNSLKPYTMQNLKTGSRSVSGDITAASSGIVYMSLPNYESSWTAYVDGREVEIQGFLGGIGIPVDAGEHHIELKYTTYGFKTGAFVSLTSLLITAVYIILYTRYKKKKSETVSEE